MSTNGRSYFSTRSLTGPNTSNNYPFQSDRLIRAPSRDGHHLQTTMDYSKFRQSGELSDLTVVVSGKEFNLHRFPLFVRSDYFASLAKGCGDSSSSSKLVIDDFPGGEQTFDLVANFCYNMKIDISRDTVCQLRCAAEFLNMKGPGNLIDITEHVLHELLTSAKLARAIDMLTSFVLTCKQLGDIAEQTGLVDKCLQGLVDCLLITARYSPRRSHLAPGGARDEEEDDEFCRMADFPAAWFRTLFTSARDKNVKASILARLIQSYTKQIIGGKKKQQQQQQPNKQKDKQTTKKDAQPQQAKQQDTKTSTATAQKQQSEPAKELVTEQPVKEEKRDSDKDTSAEAAPKKAEDKDESSESSDDDDEDADTSSSTAEKADKSGGATEKAEDLAFTPAAAAGDNKDEQDEGAADDVDSADAAAPAPGEKVKVFADAEVKLIFDAVLVEIPADSSAFADAVAPHWVVETLTVAERVDSVSKELLRRLASRILHRLTPHELSEVDCDLLAALIEASVKDNQNTGSAYAVVDNYLDELSRRDELTVPMFRRMVNTLPREQRKTHDTLFLVLERLLKSESQTVTDVEKEEVLEFVDFRKLSEATLQRAHESGLVPASYITKAAIALCSKLRSELESAKNVIRCQELELEKYGSSGRGASWLKKYDSTAPSSMYQSSASHSRYAPLSSSAKYAVNSSPALMSEWEMRLAMDSIERQAWPKTAGTSSIDAVLLDAGYSPAAAAVGSSDAYYGDVGYGYDYEGDSHSTSVAYRSLSSRPTQAHYPGTASTNAASRTGRSQYSSKK